MGPTGRTLRLLSLLQSRPVWSGPELADRLGVTTRCVRRDVDRLRSLGYPVQSSQGVGGGYQLGAGRALPPLLLDDDEAVAVAVCLRLAAGGTVVGVDEAAVRTLAKLDQVLPPRLRVQVQAVHGSTVTLDTPGQQVDADVLLSLARACRDTERVRFSYRPRDGEPAERRVEPYRLVSTGRRWYLMAFDLDRDDWRTFRLDRILAVDVTGWRFRPRETPDPADYVRRSVSQSPYQWVVRARIAAPARVVAQWVPPTAATVEPDGEAACILAAGTDDLERVALHLFGMPFEVVILDPPELRAVLRRLARRLSAAARTGS